MTWALSFKIRRLIIIIIMTWALFQLHTDRLPKAISSSTGLRHGPRQDHMVGNGDIKRKPINLTNKHKYRRLLSYILLFPFHLLPSPASLPLLPCCHQTTIHGYQVPIFIDHRQEHYKNSIKLQSVFTILLDHRQKAKT